MSDNLNLDELLPEPKTITINSKEYKCEPVSIESMLRISDLDRAVVKLETPDEVMNLIRKTLKPVIPQIDEIKKITQEQLFALIGFILKSSRPKKLEKAKDITPKKK